MFRRKDMTDEGGFTLIELLIVILIIGILAAIAVPAFLNHRKEAAVSSVKTDLHNAAITMESEMAKNKGKYLAFMPNYEHRSDGVKVTLNRQKSSPSQFCLEGRADADPSRVLYYSSEDGGLLPEGESCSDVPAGGQDYASSLSSKKILVIENRNDYPIKFDGLAGYGFEHVDFKPDATFDDFEGYDIIAAFGHAWPLSWNSETLIKQAFNAGYKVITDGNDTGHSSRPWMFAASENKKYADSRQIKYTKTGATGLNPAFPYTFTETAFNADESWWCITELAPKIVPIATSYMSNDSGIQCITAAATTNSNGGRIFHMTKYESRTADGVFFAGLDWLLS